MLIDTFLKVKLLRFLYQVHLQKNPAKTYGIQMRDIIKRHNY